MHPWESRRVVLGSAQLVATLHPPQTLRYSFSGGSDAVSCP